ncbi:MAG: flavodoxin family protein [Lautropia sp.]
MQFDTSEAGSARRAHSPAPARRRTLLIVWHSRTGACRQLAGAAAAGAARSSAVRAGGHGLRRDHGRHDIDRSGVSGGDAGAGGGGVAGCDGGGGSGDGSNGDGEGGGGGVEVAVERIAARRAGVAQMLDASAYLFVAPENLGSMAGVMKDFFDRTYYPLLDRICGRPFAVIIAAGSDGEGAVRQIGTVCRGWRLKPVAPPAIVLVHAQTAAEILAPKRVAPAELARAADIGEALAEGLALGVF